jgi:hypothetical protein
MMNLLFLQKSERLDWLIHYQLLEADTEVSTVSKLILEKSLLYMLHFCSVTVRVRGFELRSPTVMD